MRVLQSYGLVCCGCPDISPSSGAYRATFPLRGRLLRRGGVTPPYGAIKIHLAVGAGHAPPAVLRLQQHNGYSVGAAYMPPVAAIRILRTIGKTARNGQDRSLQTCRKRRTITGLCGNKNTPRGRGGARPARGQMVAQKSRVGLLRLPGHFPLIRRVPRHLPPKGKAFRWAATQKTRCNG